MGEWADLPNELLGLILSKLFPKDRHNFSLVCQSWNAAYQHSPCLMTNDGGSWKFHQFNGFFHMSFPELKKAKICCSKYGWLLMSRDNWSLFFFDPCNGQTIELPAKFDYQYTTAYFFNPPTSPDCIIVAIATIIYTKEEDVRIDVLRHGEDKWESHTYQYHREDPFRVSASGPVLHCGLLYFVDMKGDVATFDIKRHGTQSSWIVYNNCLRLPRLRNKIKHHFLFKIKGDEALYAVFLIHDAEKVNVFRLMEPDMKWELVRDLGDKTLYLSHTSSFGDAARSEKLSNTICFPKYHGDNILFYSLVTRKYHSLKGNYSNNDCCYGIARRDSATWITSAPTPELSTELVWCPKVDDSEEDDSEVDDSEEDDLEVDDSDDDDSEEDDSEGDDSEEDDSRVDDPEEDSDLVSLLCFPNFLIQDD